MCMNVFLHICLCIMYTYVAHRGRKRASNSLGLEFEDGCELRCGLLGTAPGSSERVASDFSS